ncbi:hypothetical protein NKW46_13980 [Acetobacter indonesiensis]|nr:hypothetical protein [Acetobacter indonesiensis]MCP1232178.1 hypothetical protein [Acetobacter indonesiensis]
MLMSADYRAVDHHVCVVMVSRQMSENPFNHTTFTPEQRNRRCTVFQFQNRTGKSRQ